MGVSFSRGVGSPQAFAADRWRSIDHEHLRIALTAEDGRPITAETVELAWQFAACYADVLDGSCSGFVDLDSCLTSSLEQGRTPKELFELHAALEAVLLAAAVSIDADGVGLLQARIAGQEALRSGERRIMLLGAFQLHVADQALVVPTRSPGDPTLSRRERDVLSLLAEGLRNDDIAARLILSPETVRTYAQRAMDKLGATTRIQAVVKAIRLGEIS
ncbi:MAG: hypothetical protein QOH74_823 [Gaiellales bacterium]|jgi:DNA-binding CsgD family transcriptional regulator|nr:hypothetical protein [Gaiellales bacterium]